MILFLLGICIGTLIVIMLIVLFASAKGEDKLRQASYQQYKY